MEQLKTFGLSSPLRLTNILGMAWSLMAFVNRWLSVFFFTRSSSRASNFSFFVSWGSSIRPGLLASMPFPFSRRDSSSNSKYNDQGSNKYPEKKPIKLHNQSKAERKQQRRSSHNSQKDKTQPTANTYV